MRDKKLKFLEQGTKVEAEIVNGDCPNCKCHTVLVSIYQTIFRCMTCGYDLEQKVNGVIKYVVANEQTQFKSSILDDGQETS